MTKEETKKAIEVMQAHVDGKQIQWKLKEELNWEENDDLPDCGFTWNWSKYDYQIKHEPRRFWIYESNLVGRKTFTRRDSAEYFINQDYEVGCTGKLIEVVEVIKE